MSMTVNVHTELHDRAPADPDADRFGQGTLRGWVSGRNEVRS